MDEGRVEEVTAQIGHNSKNVLEGFTGKSACQVAHMSITHQTWEDVLFMESAVLHEFVQVSITMSLIP